MAHTLTFVVVVKGRAKIEKLKWVVREIMELVRNASHFIVDYFSRGRLGMSTHSRIIISSDILICIERAARGFFLSAAQDRIAEFINSFEKLRNAMNSGVVVQVLDLFCNFGEVKSICFKVNTHSDNRVLQKKTAVSTVYVGQSLPSAGLATTPNTPVCQVHAWIP